MLICHENGFNVIFFWFGGYVDVAKFTYIVSISLSDNVC